MFFNLSQSSKPICKASIDSLSLKSIKKNRSYWNDLLVLRQLIFMPDWRGNNRTFLLLICGWPDGSLANVLYKGLGFKLTKLPSAHLKTEQVDRVQPNSLPFVLAFRCPIAQIPKVCDGHCWSVWCAHADKLFRLPTVTREAIFSSHSVPPTMPVAFILVLHSYILLRSIVNRKWFK